MVQLSADVILTSSPSFKPIFSSSVSGSRATRLSSLEQLHGNLLHRVAQLDDTIPWIRLGNDDQGLATRQRKAGPLPGANRDGQLRQREEGSADFCGRRDRRRYQHECRRRCRD
jgi:hypothetical protein